MKKIEEFVKKRMQLPKNKVKKGASSNKIIQRLNGRGLEEDKVLLNLNVNEKESISRKQINHLSYNKNNLKDVENFEAVNYMKLFFNPKNDKINKMRKSSACTLNQRKSSKNKLISDLSINKNINIVNNSFPIMESLNDYFKNKNGANLKKKKYLTSTSLNSNALLNTELKHNIKNKQNIKMIKDFINTNSGPWKGKRIEEMKKNLNHYV